MLTRKTLGVGMPFQGSDGGLFKIEKKNLAATIATAVSMAAVIVLIVALVWKSF